MLSLIISLLLIAKSFGENESAQIQSSEDVEDEPIYSNHKYFDDDSIGSIQKCNLFIHNHVYNWLTRF